MCAKTTTLLYQIGADAPTPHDQGREIRVVARCQARELLTNLTVAGYVLPPSGVHSHVATAPEIVNGCSAS